MPHAIHSALRHEPRSTARHGPRWRRSWLRLNRATLEAQLVLGGVVVDLFICVFFLTDLEQVARLEQLLVSADDQRKTLELELVQRASEIENFEGFQLSCK